jgi:hypothetical protein
MNAKLPGLAAFVLGAAMQTSLIGFAFAQGSPSAPVPAGAPPPYAGAGPEQQGEPAAPPESTSPADLPVLYVTNVEVLRTATEPKLDIVRVTGLAASRGWSAPQLVPTYAGKPFDDVLDLELIATPPDQSEDADGFGLVSAIFPLEQGHPFKGVRVRGSQNAIDLKQIPGSMQAVVNVNDCKDCMGRKFASEGHAQSGQQAIVRQEDLPKLLRLIRPTDGIRDVEQDPNRLTLILDGGDTIVEAFWE